MQTLFRFYFKNVNALTRRSKQCSFTPAPARNFAIANALFFYEKFWVLGRDCFDFSGQNTYCLVLVEMMLPGGSGAR